MQNLVADREKFLNLDRFTKILTHEDYQPHGIRLRTFSKYIPLLGPAGLTHEEQSDERSPHSKLRGRHLLSAELHTV